ncbi:hypothetical protein EDD22DRAFT_955190 [Suillus occidentalis]|nr:hypothetical protein EDD22DRAFT_955190 [Suillus occidentalis]
MALCCIPLRPRHRAGEVIDIQNRIGTPSLCDFHGRMRRYYWDDITVARHFVSYAERDLLSRATSVPVTNMKSTLTLKLLPPDSDPFKAIAGKGSMALAAYFLLTHQVLNHTARDEARNLGCLTTAMGPSCMDGIKAIDDEDEEVHHHERTKFMEDDEAFRGPSECLAPRPSRFLFFEFRQELF